MASIDAAIAATRFGLGARAGEIAGAAGDPRGWLAAQIAPDAAVFDAGGLLSAAAVIEARAEYRPQDAVPAMTEAGTAMDPAMRDQAAQAILKQVQREARDGLVKEISARTAHAVTTPAPFAERWARFWSNHFTVAARNAQMVGLVGPFEREAIRPFVFGSFAELLTRASFHQGMLIYLDAFRSAGPSSQIARRREVGLNENLAREILELHTLGVGSGYTQEDIVEFAKALTGWTVAAAAPRGLVRAGGRRGEALAEAMEERRGETVFLAALHEPGARSILSRRYAEAGAEQAAEVLADLAAHPATARHLGFKLARHFVADAPPEAAVDALARRYLETGGDLSELARAVIALDAAWDPANRKFKTPDELLISTARGFGVEAALGREAAQLYQSLAQAPFSAPSPAGWPDEAAAWSGADAIRKRLDWANQAARRAKTDLSPSDFLDSALGPLAGAATRQAVARAETAEQGFTLALMSPDFQRR